MVELNILLVHIPIVAVNHLNTVDIQEEQEIDLSYNWILPSGGVEWES